MGIEKIGGPNVKLSLANSTEESKAYTSQVVGGRYLGQERTSSAYFRALQIWLESCISSHPGCCKRMLDDSSQTFEPYNAELPTHCIEVSPDGGCFLRYTAGLHGGYATLSHRWNKFSEACKTTTTNYDDRIAGQDLESVGNLSQTFLDAVAVARGLGIPYVWIDSLCIVQGSTDWDKEKGHMGRYYQHSLFTISAIMGVHGSGAADSIEPSSDKGFLAMSSDAGSVIRSIVRMPYHEKGVRQGNVYIYRRKESADAQFVREVDRSELMMRGWVFQEWLLSRRIVYFAPSETFVECVSARPMSLSNDAISRLQNLPAEETNAGNEEASSAEKHSAQNATIRYGFKTDIQEQQQHQGWAAGIYQNWYTHVMAYSTTRLTKQEDDHLVAISGIADEYLARTEERNRNKQATLTPNLPRYLSGLWLEDICYGLLWFSQNSSALTETCGCPAPSWSWLSLASPVAWPSRHPRVQQHLQIVETATTTTTTTTNESTINEDTGTRPVAEGVAEAIAIIARLTVKAKLQPLLVAGRLEDLSHMKLLTGVQLAYGSNSYDCYAVSSPATPTYAGGWAVFEQLPPTVPMLDEPTSAAVVIALHVATRKNVPGLLIGSGLFSQGHDVDEVLFVEPVGGDGTYRRVGMGMVFHPTILKAFRHTKHVEIALL